MSAVAIDDVPRGTPDTFGGLVRDGETPEETGDQLQFELDGGQYRLSIERLTADALRKRDGHAYSYPANVDWEAKAEAEWRRIWRANVLLLKAKLEFIESGDTTLDRELLSYRVLANGQTLGQVIDSGGLKMLAAGKPA